MLLAFCLYISAPILRARLSPPLAAQPNPSPIKIPDAPQPKVDASRPQTKSPLKKASAVQPERQSIASPAAPPVPTAEQSSAENSSPSSQPPVQSVPEPAPQRGHLYPEANGVRHTVFSLLPGEELDLSNSEFNYIKIDSDYPVVFKVGDCQASETRQIVCNNIDPNLTIQIQDTRIGIPVGSVPENKVRILAIQH